MEKLQDIIYPNRMRKDFNDKVTDFNKKMLHHDIRNKEINGCFKRNVKDYPNHYAYLAFKRDLANRSYQTDSKSEFDSDFNK